MRKLASYLVILIFITAYGRCVADQFGMLHSSEASCCVTTCDTDDHCAATSDNDHTGDPHLPESEDREEPSPCQLCHILNSDSMISEDGVKLPSPILLELNDFSSFSTELDDILRGLVIPPVIGLAPSDYPDPSAEQRATLLRLGSKTTPVRGPSVA